MLLLQPVYRWNVLTSEGIKLTVFLLVGRLQMNIEFLTAHLLRPLSSIKLAGADQHNRLFTFQGLTSDRPMRRANQM
jgi:hypothetical protein